MGKRLQQQTAAPLTQTAVAASCWCLARYILWPVSAICSAGLVFSTKLALQGLRATCCSCSPPARTLWAVRTTPSATSACAMRWSCVWNTSPPARARCAPACAVCSHSKASASHQCSSMSSLGFTKVAEVSTASQQVPCCCSSHSVQNGGHINMMTSCSHSAVHALPGCQHVPVHCGGCGPGAAHC